MAATRRRPRHLGLGRRRRTVLLGLSLLGATLVAVGVVDLLPHRPGPPAALAAPAGAGPATPGWLLRAERAAHPGDRPAARPPVPTALELPRLGIEAPVLAAGTDPTGKLLAPTDPRRLGWWAAGPRPGAARGTAVIGGHVDYAGVLGAFYWLDRARPGDRVYVRSGGRWLRYRVTAERSYPKTRLPYRSLFAADVPGRLVLITCGGVVRAGHYLDNVVVTAVPA